MQVQWNFRDMQSYRWCYRLSYSHSRSIRSLQNLLLVVTMGGRETERPDLAAPAMPDSVGSLRGRSQAFICLAPA